MATVTNARFEFYTASVEEWEKVNPKLHQGEPVLAKKPNGKYILKVGGNGGSTYKESVIVWDQDDAETKMENTQTAATEALASKNAAAASASAAKTSETAAAASKSAAATSAANAETSETNAAASKASAANSASTASTKATEAGNSASAAAASEKSAASSASASATSERNALKSASAASTSAGNAKTSETSAAASAKAAKQSENNAKTWDPTQYVQSVTELNGKVTVTKGDGKSSTFNAGLNILARNKAYSVGDIAYSPNLPSYLYLECTTAGTTGATEPDMSTVSGGVMVDDGTAKFSVKTVCAKEYVDALRKSDEPVQVPITNLAGTNIIASVECFKAGHVVTVHINVRKVENAAHVGDRQYALLTGLPHPANGAWVWVIGPSLGITAGANKPTIVRGVIVEDFFSWHYSPEFTYQAGNEVYLYVTYLTNE